jgi:hypothetical protein
MLARTTTPHNTISQHTHTHISAPSVELSNGWIVDTQGFTAGVRRAAASAGRDAGGAARDKVGGPVDGLVGGLVGRMVGDRQEESAPSCCCPIVLLTGLFGDSHLHTHAHHGTKMVSAGRARLLLLLLLVLL